MPFYYFYGYVILTLMSLSVHQTLELCEIIRVNIDSLHKGQAVS